MFNSVKRGTNVVEREIYTLHKVIVHGAKDAFQDSYDKTHHMRTAFCSITETFAHSDICSLKSVPECNKNGSGKQKEFIPELKNYSEQLDL